MKGLVFTEFLDMVEARFGLAIKFKVLDGAQLAHGGSYTAVGNYPHGEMMRLVAQLSESSGLPQEALLQAFGEYMFGLFTRRYGHFFAEADSAIEFLRHIEDYIHVEVRKLYPDAELPTFSYPSAPAGTLIMEYRSPRPLAAFAEGLIRATITHFQQPVQLTVQPLEGAPPGTAARFTLQ